MISPLETIASIRACVCFDVPPYAPFCILLRVFFIHSTRYQRELSSYALHFERKLSCSLFSSFWTVSFFSIIHMTHFPANEISLRISHSVDNDISSRCGRCFIILREASIARVSLGFLVQHLSLLPSFASRDFDRRVAYYCIVQLYNVWCLFCRRLDCRESLP